MVYLDKTNTNIYYVDLNSVTINETNKGEDENSRIEIVEGKETHAEGQ